jgi:hypothetical protein
MKKAGHSISRSLVHIGETLLFLCLLAIVLECGIQGYRLVMYGISDRGNWIHVLAGTLWCFFGGWILSHVRISWRK